MCLLRNDMNMEGIGFSPSASPIYMILKRQEISRRKGQTGDMFL